MSLKALKTKLYDELEAMVARYLRPVNLQLADIYQRLSTLEKRINQYISLRKLHLFRALLDLIITMRIVLQDWNLPNSRSEVDQP